MPPDILPADEPPSVYSLASAYNGATLSSVCALWVMQVLYAYRSFVPPVWPYAPYSSARVCRNFPGRLASSVSRQSIRLWSEQVMGGLIVPTRGGFEIDVESAARPVKLLHITDGEVDEVRGWLDSIPDDWPDLPPGWFERGLKPARWRGMNLGPDFGTTPAHFHAVGLLSDHFLRWGMMTYAYAQMYAETGEERDELLGMARRCGQVVLGVWIGLAGILVHELAHVFYDYEDGLTSGDLPPEPHCGVHFCETGLASWFLARATSHTGACVVHNDTGVDTAWSYSMSVAQYDENNETQYWFAATLDSPGEAAGPAAFSFEEEWLQCAPP